MNTLVKGTDGFIELSSLTKTDLLSSEIYDELNSIDDLILYTQRKQTVLARASELRVKSAVNDLIRAHEINRNAQKKGNRAVLQQREILITEYDLNDKPEYNNLNCPSSWIVNDSGVKTIDSHGEQIDVCLHPIMPVRVYRDIENGNVRIVIAFKNGNTYWNWTEATVDLAVISDASKIIPALSGIGVGINSINAKLIIKFLTDCIGLNGDILVPERSISRLGWNGEDFIPYKDNLAYSGSDDFQELFEAIEERGDIKKWKETCKEARKSKAVRLVMAASVASVILEKVNALPFGLHLWGAGSGSGKTVTMEVAASVWGNPKKLMRSLNSTENYIYRTAAFLKNLPFFGDELETIRQKNAPINYDDFVYRFTEGIDRARAKKTGGVERSSKWHSVLITSGEEPIIKENSMSGSRNRIVEVMVTHKLIENGNKTVTDIRENYGFAGKEIIKYIAEYPEDIRKLFGEASSKLVNRGISDKQANSGACLLIGDFLLTKMFFPDDEHLKIEDIVDTLCTLNQVNSGRKAFNAVIGFVAQYQNKFYNQSIVAGKNTCIIGANDYYTGEYYGAIQGDIYKINKDILSNFLSKNGFADIRTVLAKWADEGLLIKNSQGRNIHADRINKVQTATVWVDASKFED